jgi:hypothetical protein
MRHFIALFVCLIVLLSASLTLGQPKVKFTTTPTFGTTVKDGMHASPPALALGLKLQTKNFGGWSYSIETGASSPYANTILSPFVAPGIQYAFSTKWHLGTNISLKYADPGRGDRYFNLGTTMILGVAISPDIGIGFGLGIGTPLNGPTGRIGLSFGPKFSFTL